MMKLSNKLYLSRVANRWSQKYVAKQVGVTASMVSLYERGLNTPSEDVMKRLAILFDINEEKLFKKAKNIRKYEKLDNLTEEQKITRKKEQQKRARQKYYLKNKKKFHQYYEERKKRNGVSRN